MAEKTGITYIKGDATAPRGEGIKVITHVCNDLGGWGKGFVLALSRRWPEPEAAYRRWHRERAHNDFGLGAAQFVQVADDLWVANVVGQQGIRPSPSRRGPRSPKGETSPGDSGVPVRYEAIDAGLGRVADGARRLGASVHMPRIGCGLAGGVWARVEPLISGRLARGGISVTVYDR
ncbi:MULTISPECIES: macro domain-containing protein [Streptomyces]|uniref:Appr-1-p processing protein n=1 Tax=Streptomyces TaxID=1883 RepID=UPI002555C108|nr:Appr-1-p processing protein [Streptomyces sp. NBRC 13847]